MATPAIRASFTLLDLPPFLDVSLRFTLCGLNEKRPTQRSPWEEWLVDTARNVRTRIARPSESAMRLISSTWLCVATNSASCGSCARENRPSVVRLKILRKIPVCLYLIPHSRVSLVDAGRVSAEGAEHVWVKMLSCFKVCNTWLSFTLPMLNVPQPLARMVSPSIDSRFSRDTR